MNLHWHGLRRQLVSLIDSVDLILDSLVELDHLLLGAFIIFHCRGLVGSRREQVYDPLHLRRGRGGLLEVLRLFICADRSGRHADLRRDAAVSARSELELRQDSLVDRLTALFPEKVGPLTLLAV